MAAPSADKPARRPGSRTTWAFPPGSPAWRSWRARTTRRRSSAPRWRYPTKSCVCDAARPARTGVSSWASPLEGKLCAAQEVALVGAGNSAGQAVVYLASHVTRLWLLVRGASLEASMSRYLVDRIAALPNVEVLVQTDVTALEGQGGMLEAVRWRH